jgi:hypothetical protein
MVAMSNSADAPIATPTSAETQSMTSRKPAGTWKWP